MDDVLMKICKVVEKFDIERVVLYGSRSRDDYTLLSDYDIALYGSRMSEFEKANLSLEIDEIDTLKKIDIVFVDEKIDDKLINNINMEGIIIYEQTKN